MSDDNVAPVSSDVAAAMDTEAKKQFWTQVLYKLPESKRFLDFLKANYVIGVIQNDDDKTVDVLVTENPVVAGPPLAPEQIFKIHVACTRAKARNPKGLLDSIMAILGQEGSSIVMASEAELLKAVEQEDLKVGLDA